MKLQLKMWIAVIITTIIYTFLIPDAKLALVIPAVTFIISIINKFITKFSVPSPIKTWYKGFVIVNVFLIITILVSVSMEKGFDISIAITTLLGVVFLLLFIYFIVKIIDKKNKRLMIVKSFISLIVGFGLMMPSTAYSEKWSEVEVIATGKNIITMAGFYKTCGDKNLTPYKGKVLRWSSFIGSKYLAIAGLEKELSRFYGLGKKGYLVKDPSISDELFTIDFTNDSCRMIQKLLETNSNLVEALFHESTK